MSNDFQPTITGWDTDGYWWIGEDQTVQVPGKLVFSENSKIRLLLNGSFANFAEAQSEKYQHIPIVNGITRDGKFVCLSNCIIGSSSMRSPGYYSQEYNPHCIYVGINAKSDDDLLFDSAYFEIDNLWSWLQPEVFTQKYDINNETKRINKYTVESFEQKYDLLKINDFSLSYYSSYQMNNPQMTNESNIHFSISVGYTFNSPTSIAQAVNHYGMAFQELISLATSKNCRIRKVQLKSSRHKQIISGQPSENDQSIDCLLPQIFGKTEVEVPYGYLFLHNDIKDKPAEYLTTWFNKKESIKPVYDLYFHVIRQRSMLVQHAFLSLVNCIEVFHRRVIQNIDMDKYNVIMKSIQDSVSKENWEWITPHLGYAYEPKLRKRLNEVFDRMPQVVKDVIGNKKEFINDIVTARNYLTHFDSKLEKSYKGNSLNEFNAKLRMQIQVLLLQELGFDNDKIVEKIRGSNGFLFVPKTIIINT